MTDPMPCPCGRTDLKLETTATDGSVSCPCGFRMVKEHSPGPVTDGLEKAIAAWNVRSPTCRRCGAPMKPGLALKQTYTGTGDFHGDDNGVTLSPGGPGRLIDCVKCEACGWSVSND